MKFIIEEIDSLKDRDILYENSYVKVAKSFIYFTVFLLFTLILLAKNVKIEQSTNFEGNINFNYNKEAVLCPINGTIKTVNLEDGMEVKKGDKLLVLDTNELELTKSQLYEVNSQIKSQLNANKNYLSSLKQNKNLLDIENKYERKYFYQFTNYMEEINTIEKSDNVIDLDKEAKKNKIFNEYSLIAESEQLTIEKELYNNENDIEVLEKKIESSIILAERDGIINLQLELIPGMYVNENSMLGYINSKREEEKIKVNVIVPNEEITLIKENQDLKLQVLSNNTNSNEFIDGEVFKIPSKSTVIENTNYSYYIVEVLLDKETLYDKYGENLELKEGMKVNVKLINSEITYFDYITEKLFSIKNN